MQLSPSKCENPLPPCYPAPYDAGDLLQSGRIPAGSRRELDASGDERSSSEAGLWTAPGQTTASRAKGH